MSKLISTEFEGTIQLNGHDYSVVICYQYGPESLEIIVGDCYTSRGIKSALLKKRVEEDLPIFLEEQARKDCDRLSELAWQERIDREEYAGDMKHQRRMEDERAA